MMQVRFAQTDSHDDLQTNVSVITLRSLMYFACNNFTEKIEYGKLTDFMVSMN